ncbi:MAG: GspE/PulE family protein [Acidobacteriota bacterium]
MTSPEAHFSERFFQYLRSQGLGHELGVRRVLAETRQGQRNFVSALVEEELVTTQQVFEAMENLLNIPAIELCEIGADVSILDVVPGHKALEFQVIPLFLVANSLVLAMSDPFDLAKIDQVGFLTGKQVLPVFAMATDIATHLPIYYGGGARTDRRSRAAAGTLDVAEADGLRPVVRLVNSILRDAIEIDASDIHIEPLAEGVRVRNRVHGLLVPSQVEIPDGLRGALTRRIKILAGLDISEPRKPQDGKIAIKMGERSVEIRVSTFPSSHGEKAVLRILNSEPRFGLDTLGLSTESLGCWKRLLKGDGLLLVTGPTGSGKTSTLYASLRYLRHPELNIVTLEDPIEYEIAGITQSQVNPKAGFTFDKGLRSLLRQDPDVIMVGEIRDRETAALAVQAALTGHLVLATLHTRDSLGAVTRLVDLGIPRYLVAQTLRCVVAQRLLRIPCACRLGGAEVSPDCERCKGTGYRGRFGVFEQLNVTSRLQELIVDGASKSSLVAAAQSQGFKPLRQSALELVDTGATDIDEVARALPTVAYATALAPPPLPLEAIPDDERAGVDAPWRPH